MLEKIKNKYAVFVLNEFPEEHQENLLTWTNPRNDVYDLLSEMYNQMISFGKTTSDFFAYLEKDEQEFVKQYWGVYGPSDHAYGQNVTYAYGSGTDQMVQQRNMAIQNAKLGRWNSYDINTVPFDSDDDIQP